jgi:hypothetical protein
MIGNIISPSSECSKLKAASAKPLSYWIELFESNIRKLKEISQTGNGEHLKQITNRFSSDLHAMQEWLKLEPSDEFTDERDRLRSLKIMKDKKRIGIL